MQDSDPLFWFVVAVIWAVVTWKQKRREAREREEGERLAAAEEARQVRPAGGPSQRPSPAPKPAPSGGGWEDELRRLLEGGPIQPKPKPAPAPPPAPVRNTGSAPPPLPPPAPRPAPRPTVPSAPAIRSASRPQPLLPQAAEPAPAPKRFAPPKLVSDIDGDYFHKGACEHCGGRLLFPQGAVGHSLNCPHCSRDTRLLPSQALEESDAGSAYAAKRRPAKTTAKEVAAMFSSQNAAQRAVIASIVFGPPKALEGEGNRSGF